MTRSPTRFPIASRFLAVTLALVAIAALSVHAAAAPSHQDVQSANAKVRKLLADVNNARDTLGALESQLADATAQVDDAQGRYEQITAELIDTKQLLDQAQQEYRTTMNRLNERAVQAYIQGPGQDFEFLTGAVSLGDLSDRIEYVNALAQSDADLAQTVQNTKNRLADQQARLGDLRTKQQALVAQAEAAAQAVADNFAQQQQQYARIKSDLAQAERYKKKVAKQYQQALKLAAQQGYGGAHGSVAIPPGYDGVFQQCPVDGPRSFSDGFGAPRYAGGYHLHKGVDILSPDGTPIVAPFDGVAHTDYNTLGGNVVFVAGKYGEVYNAHLSAFSGNSNGPVRAGDVIGYVGDTGDATGIFHDHFEFHPNMMPSSWPASPYGYSIIEDAVDPYPLLVAACG
jgi:murein DD-endopeptidase MepM/ murein hydrolase activator NlpD